MIKVNDNGTTRMVPLIGVSGPSGCGKSTLTKLIADQCGIALYESQTRKVRAKYGLRNHSDIVLHSATDADHLYNFQSDVLAGRASIAISDAVAGDHRKRFGVITDRTPIDSLVYFLFQTVPLLDEPHSYEFLTRVMVSLIGYDLIVVLEPLSKVENDGERIPNRVFQMTSHWLFREACRFVNASWTQAEGGPTLVDESEIFPRRSKSLESRVELVLESLKVKGITL